MATLRFRTVAPSALAAASVLVSWSVSHGDGIDCPPIRCASTERFRSDVCRCVPLRDRAGRGCTKRAGELGATNIVAPGDAPVAKLTCKGLRRRAPVKAYFRGVVSTHGDVPGDPRDPDRTVAVRVTVDGSTHLDTRFDPVTEPGNHNRDPMVSLETDVVCTTARGTVELALRLVRCERASGRRCNLAPDFVLAVYPIPGGCPPTSTRTQGR